MFFGVLLLSLVGARVKKSDKLNYRIAFAYFLTGLFIYFISGSCLYIPLPDTSLTIVYILTTAIGYILIMTGGGLMSRIIKDKLNNDVFTSKMKHFRRKNGYCKMSIP